jgi:hypothetical protein
VAGPAAYGDSPVVGTGTAYARNDHLHGLPAAPPVLHIRAYRANPYNWTNSTAILVYDTVAEDSLSYPGRYSVSTGLFTAPVAGTYLVTTKAAVTPTAAGQTNDIRVYKNGALYSLLGAITSQAAVNVHVVGAATVRLAVNDTLGLYVTGGAATLTGVTGTVHTWINFDYLGNG